MPEANQYVVTNRELIELILKSLGIRDGKWSLMVNFGMLPGGFGPNPAQIMPGMAVLLQNVGIQREPPDSKAPPELIVDAAKLKD
jgi:hypothetical protein